MQLIEKDFEDITEGELRATTLDDLAEYAREIVKRGLATNMPDALATKLFYAISLALDAQQQESGTNPLALRRELEDLSLTYFPDPEGGNIGGYYLAADGGAAEAEAYGENDDGPDPACDDHDSNADVDDEPDSYSDGYPRER